jgi:hypothetical protein
LDYPGPQPQKLAGSNRFRSVFLTLKFRLVIENHNQQRQQSTIKGEAALADVNDCYLAAL